MGRRNMGRRNMGCGSNNTNLAASNGLASPNGDTDGVPSTRIVRCETWGTLGEGGSKSEVGIEE